MDEHQRRIERTRSIEREYKAGCAAELLADRLEADPSWRGYEGWRNGDAEDFRRNLGPTFIIRLFAEFEAGLRDYWARGRRRKSNSPVKESRPPMKDLLDSIGNKRKVPPALLAQVHQVRFETATSTMEMNRKLN